MLNAVHTITDIFHVEGTFISLNEEARKENSQIDSESSTVEKVGSKRPCTMYFLRNHGLITLASKFKELNPVMVEPIISLFQVLIEDVCAVDRGIAADQDLVLGVTAFLQSMMTFNIIGRASEFKFCEFMFSTASMMKVYDGLLLSWFQIIDKVAGAPALASIPSKTRENLDSTSTAQTVIDNGYHREFPLFCLLLNYVHHGGKSGEYSRTGLLYLIEVASESEALVNWVLKSDLSSLMASGLCALYSQLSRTIQQPELNHEPKDRFDQKDLDVFLSYLLFWQDMLTFAQKSTSLTKNLVYHFDVLFVRQLLYNSIVESTDYSGGYSDSLLSILTSILETLNHDLLSQAIVCYFIGHPVSHAQAVTSSNARPPSSISLYSFKQGSPILTLGDVICSTLADDSSKRVHALRLCCVLFFKYYPYTMDTLIPIKRSVPANGGSLKTLTVVQSVCKSVLSDIMDSVTMNGKVDQYKRDIELMAERTPFPSPSLQKRYLAEELMRLETSGQILLKQNYPHYTLRMHQLQEQELSNIDKADENLLTIIMGKLLPNFFTNSISENLTLTLVIIELGTCGWLNLEGWATQVLLEAIERLREEYMEITSRVEGFEGTLEKLKQDMGSNDPELQKEDFSDDEQSSLQVIESEDTAIESRRSSFRGWIPSPLRAKELVTRSFSVISHLSVRSMVFSDDEDGAQDSGNESARDLRGITPPNLNCSIDDSSDEPERLSKQGSQDQLLNAIEINGTSIQLMDFCTNALIFQDFVCELMALYHVRFWLFDNH